MFERVFVDRACFIRQSCSALGLRTYYGNLRRARKWSSRPRTMLVSLAAFPTCRFPGVSIVRMLARVLEADVGLVNDSNVCVEKVLRQQARLIFSHQEVLFSIFSVTLKPPAFLLHLESHSDCLLRPTYQHITTITYRECLVLIYHFRG